MADAKQIAEILRRHEDEILTEWVALQKDNLAVRNNLLKLGELEQQCREFLRAFIEALAGGSGDVQSSPAWASSREVLTNTSRARARQGFSPTETATFVFSLKQPVFHALRNELSAE